MKSSIFSGLMTYRFFAYVINFSKTKRKSTKPSAQRCFSCQNKSVCQKLAPSCKKLKIGPKCYDNLFAQKPSIILMEYTACLLFNKITIRFLLFFIQGKTPKRFPCICCLSYRHNAITWHQIYFISFKIILSAGNGFCILFISKTKSNTAIKNFRAIFLIGETNSAIFEHFQNGQKI